MLTRWMTLKLCKTEGELRLMVRLVRQWEHTAPDERQAPRDRRITRRVRLSLLWAVLTTAIEAPNRLVLGVISVTGIIAFQLLRLSIYVWSIL